MDVALDRADDHRPDFRSAGLCQEWPKDGHAGLHRVGSHQNLGNEQDAVAEVDTDNCHALDKRLGQDFIRRPSTFKQDINPFTDLVLETVIEVVMHLLDKFVVVQFGQDDIFFIGHGTAPLA